ncbi:Hypothetical predicted protein, partial [Mytilus galloprovincialis]
MNYFDPLNPSFHIQWNDISALDGSVLVFSPTENSTPNHEGKIIQDLKVCDDCGKTFRSMPGFREHRQREHGQQQRYTCGQCNKGFMSKTLFKSHILQHCQEKQFKCKDCKKEYVHKKDLENHITAQH